MVMERQRPQGDGELHASDVEDITGQSEQEGPSSLRSSWSLVSHSSPVLRGRVRSQSSCLLRLSVYRSLA